MRISARSVVVVAAAMGAAAGAFLLARLSAPTPTEEAQIRALFVDTARAVQEKRVGDAMRAISLRFQGEGLDHAGLKGFVTFHALRGEWSRVAVAGDRIAIDGDAAAATVHVLLARSGQGDTLPDLLPTAGSAYRIACALAREDEGWRVVGASWKPIPLDEALAVPPEPGR
jgi:hypothetical protein